MGITENSDDLEVLPELTSELFELIAKRLNVVSFCAFGAVCKSWMEICDRSREDFLESQAPLAVLTSSSSSSSHDIQTCYLYDMANGKKMNHTLHDMVGKVFIGCSAGYVAYEDMKRHIYLVNPLTGHQLSYHAPPYFLRGKSLHDHVILASTLSSKSDVMFLAISHSKCEYQVFYSRTGGWFMALLFGEQSWVDVAVFKNQVYAVSSTAQLGKLRIKPFHKNWLNCTFIWLQDVRNTPKVNSNDLKLVVSNNQLLMVDFVPEKHLNIYMMDFDAMEWIKLDKLGDQALFLGGKLGSAIRKPGRWGGQSNCVYYLDTSSARCCTYSMEAKLIDNFPLMENPTTYELCSLGWYYPHQCMKVNYLAIK